MPPGPPRRSGAGAAGLVFRPVVVAAAVVLFAAAAGALFYVMHHTSRSHATANPPQVTQTTPPAPGPSASVLTGSESPPDSPSPSSSGTVTVGADVSQDPDASPVADFLGQYFAAINAHDYQSYLSLLSSQVRQGMTQEQFDKGYRSTVDSGETLVSISPASDGDLAAEVTFTSHQNPADSPDQSESCTDWDITLFLAQDGSGYLIDPAPSGYHAAYQPCS